MVLVLPKAHPCLPSAGLLIAACWMIAFILAIPAGVAAEPRQWSGKVLAVVAGDTLKVMQGKLAKIVHLHGVEAPQAGQPWGEEARRFVQGLAQGLLVTVEPRGSSRTGRQLNCTVILPDGRDLGMELLKEGLAWYDKRRGSDPFLGELEGNARRERLGMWSDVKSVPSRSRP